MNKYYLFILLSFVYPQRDCLQEADTDAFGRSTRPEKDTFSESPSGHFYIHYDIEGSAAPDPEDIAPANGVPDYVDEVGIIADFARHVLVDVDMLGYASEPSDGTTGGGEGKYDIYIMSYGAGSYGFCMSEGSGRSYLKIDNDYIGYNSNFGQTPFEIMQISLVHEYFHAIQFGYSVSLSGNTYFYEMSSMWFEDVIIPHGNDYLDGWADPLLNNPTVDFDDTGNGYELALFGHYLSSFLDPQGVGNVTNSTIIREMWESFGSNAFSAISSTLENNYNTPFIEAWIDFISRNLYNGIYDDMENPFYYYIDQALISPIQINLQTLENNQNIELILDNKSAAIQSYQISESISLDITHSSDEYLGRISIVSTSDYNDLFWGTDTSHLVLESNSEIHFVYGSENQGSVTIDITESSPVITYNYSLVDLNPNSATYNETISPGYFEDQVTLHYFGHQY